MPGRRGRGRSQTENPAREPKGEGRWPALPEGVRDEGLALAGVGATRDRDWGPPRGAPCQVARAPLTPTTCIPVGLQWQRDVEARSLGVPGVPRCSQRCPGVLRGV